MLMFDINLTILLDYVCHSRCKTQCMAALAPLAPLPLLKYIHTYLTLFILRCYLFISDDFLQALQIAMPVPLAAYRVIVLCLQSLRLRYSVEVASFVSRALSFLLFALYSLLSVFASPAQFTPLPLGSCHFQFSPSSHLPPSFPGTCLLY